MFTIYNPGHEFQDDIFGCYHANFVPFDIEKKDWRREKNLNDAQFIAVNGNDLTPDNIDHKIQLLKSWNLQPHHKILILYIWHLDNKIRDKDHFKWIRKTFKEHIDNDLAIVHTNFAHDEEIPYDWLWNRQKIYFTNYNYIDLKGRSYTHDTDANTFQLTHIAKTPIQPNVEVKHYLSPIRIYSQVTHPRFEYRKKLKEFLMTHSDKGYFSDIESGNMLTCENNILPFRLIGGGWYPIANRFYNTTILSTYIETVTGIYGPDYADVKYKSITEKTWDPLIKGHFILPFAYPGFIEHLKTYGFLLPDWIDYSYDSIENDEERFIAFTKSLENFFQYGTHEILQFFYNGRDILNHNRMVFWDRPYDSLYQKVKNYFKM